MMISSTIIINKLLRIQNNIHLKNHHLLFYHRSGFNVGKLSSSLSSSFCIQNHQQQRSLSSTSTTSTSTTIESSSSKRNCDKLDLTFSNTEQAYRSKTTFELIRAIAVLYVSSFDTLVYNHDKVSVVLVFLGFDLIFNFYPPPKKTVIKMVKTFNG